MKLISNLFIRKKVTCKKILMKKTKKSQPEINMSFTYNKSFSLNLHVLYINGNICTFSKFFPKIFPLEITCKQVFLHVFTGRLSKI
jgi:hypothetical protein